MQSGGDARAEVGGEVSKYKANDLVIYNNNKSVGLVLNVERDFINVLDSYGEVKSIRAQEINFKKETEYLPS